MYQKILLPFVLYLSRNICIAIFYLYKSSIFLEKDAPTLCETLCESATSIASVGIESMYILRNFIRNRWTIDERVCLFVIKSILLAEKNLEVYFSGAMYATQLTYFV